MDDSPAAKRRKLRKGTTSCWECKRRKTRCKYLDPASDVCISCDRRGALCVSQEYPPDSTRGRQGRGTAVTDEPSRILEEGIFIRDTSQVLDSQRTSETRTRGFRGSLEICPNVCDPDQDGREELNTDLTPSLFECDITGYDPEHASRYETLADPAGSASAQQSRRLVLSGRLHAMLPSQKDADVIIGAGNTAAFLQFFTLPYRDLSGGKLRCASTLAALPAPTAHPVLLARSLLYLVNGIQNLELLGGGAAQLDLGPATQQAMQRYLEASQLVTARDDMLAYAEGLECLVLEGVYHINAGDLRRAWLLFKRAMGLAQLMDLHRGNRDQLIALDPAMADVSPALLWYRIVTQDRYLAMMLCVPAGTSDNSLLASDDLFNSKCPSGRLECIHSVIMGRIASRNKPGNRADDYTATKAIDRVLHKAASTMPPEWWLMPNGRVKKKASASGHESKTRLSDIMRILVQITHYNLLNILHLPHMLLKDTTITDDRSYSRNACANASRELLQRYIRLRSLNEPIFACRAIDLSAFTAGLAVLLVHLDGARCGEGGENGGFLMHQRLSDRAMVVEAVELMLDASSGGDDTVSQQIAAILRCLLDIEATAVDASTEHGNGQEHLAHAGDLCLRLTIPAVGKATITTQGAILSVTQLQPSDIGAMPVFEQTPPTPPPDQWSRPYVAETAIPQPRRTEVVPHADDPVDDTPLDAAGQMSLEASFDSLLWQEGVPLDPFLGLSMADIPSTRGNMESSGLENDFLDSLLSGNNT